MIKAGFIGAGGICGIHLKCLQAHKDVKIVALCDINREQALKRQSEFGGEVFDDFEEMLGKVRLDAVWLCTPPAIRRAPLLACAARGIPVFCEKPVERSEAEGRKIAAELRKRKAKVQVGYVFRSMPLIRELRRIMKDDRVHLVHSFYFCNASLTMSLRKWFYDKKKSGGGLMDQATHNLDLLRYLFGEVAEVRGAAENPVRKKRPGYTIDETIGLLMTFGNGIMASHLHSWVADRWRNEIIFSGEKRLYRLNLNAGELSCDQPAVAAADLYSEKGGKKKLAGGPFRFKQEPISIWQYENDIFVKQVKSGDWSGNPSDYADGLKSLHLTLACERALSQGLVKV